MSTYPDPVGEFEKRVAQKCETGMLRRDAVVAVAKADRELHRAYLKATNPPSVHRLIDSRFDMAPASTR